MSRKSKPGIKWPHILLGAGAVTAGTALLGRALAGYAARWFATRLMTEPYENNLWEVISATNRTSLQTFVETNIRAERGQMILRPFGDTQKFLDMDKVMFNVAQLDTFPTSYDLEISSAVVLGPRARRPLRLDIPVIISGMAYGFGLSEKAKVALAKGAAQAGTATNTGYGPFLPEEREAARFLIMQYNRGNWCKDPETLKKSDMLEIQLGQGALAGTGAIFKRSNMDGKMIRLLGLQPGQDAVLHARLPEIDAPGQLGGLVDELKKIMEGKPVGVKIAAGNSLEKDLAHILDAGADFISVDGAQGGTSGGAPTLQDDFGLPTLHALCRTARFLEQQGVKNKVSLIIGGGLTTPGDYLKALALGADAVNIGTIALWAMTHTQVFQSLPYEPPLQVVLFHGRDKEKLDVDKGARNLANYLKSTVDEMKMATAALGKKSLRAVNSKDLFALDKDVAAIAGIPLAWGQS
ncbi:MAG: FMN-binding glutamate synthase family protein [Firmicutes bacterium]|nr:FMN-binding glutamate synthase family protein [Bacillota bacterium]